MGTNKSSGIQLTDQNTTWFWWMILAASLLYLVWSLKLRLLISLLYEAKLTSRFNKKIIKFSLRQRDNFKIGALETFFIETGIHYELICRTPENDDVSENMFRNIVEKGTCMLIGSNLPKSFWTEEVYTAVYLIKAWTTWSVFLWLIPTWFIFSVLNFYENKNSGKPMFRIDFILRLYERLAYEWLTHRQIITSLTLPTKQTVETLLKIVKPTTPNTGRRTASTEPPVP